MTDIFENDLNFDLIKIIITVSLHESLTSMKLIVARKFLFSFESFVSVVI